MPQPTKTLAFFLIALGCGCPEAPAADDAGPASTVTDSGATPDGGATMDSGFVTDAGSAARDGGDVPDAGSPASDAGNEVTDSGAPGQDAGAAQNPIVDVGPAILIQEGFNFLEGPVWRSDEGVLLFSDIPENKIFRLTPPSSIDTFRDPSDNANGLVNHTDGSLLAAEHGARRISRTVADGGVAAFADAYQGAAFNSPNDIAVRSDGVVYFTDPPYGLGGRTREIDFNGVFRVNTDGTVVAEWQGDLASRPNGLVLSPDESLLYVADTAGNEVRLYDVGSDGALSGERSFVSVDTPDGMAMDAQGNLYVTTSLGVEVFAPDASPWGAITVDRTPANCTFGGTDGKTLFITARQGLYSVNTLIPGMP